MVAVDGVRAVLVTPRAEIRPQAKPQIRQVGLWLRMLGA